MHLLEQWNLAEVLGPLPPMCEDPDEAPDSWLCLGPAFSFRAIWGLNQWMEDLSLPLSLSLCHSAFQINKSFTKTLIKTIRLRSQQLYLKKNHSF